MSTYSPNLFTFTSSNFHRLYKVFLSQVYLARKAYSDRSTSLILCFSMYSAENESSPYNFCSRLFWLSLTVPSYWITMSYSDFTNLRWM